MSMLSAIKILLTTTFVASFIHSRGSDSTPKSQPWKNLKHFFKTLVLVKGAEQRTKSIRRKKTWSWIWIADKSQCTNP